MGRSVPHHGSALLAFLFPEEDIDIHQPLGCSREELRRIRRVSLLAMSLIFAWQTIIAKTVFIQVKYLTLIGAFCTWSYLVVVCLDDLLRSRPGWGIALHPK
jgi:hypothetical protein